jgi:hypothetical protein
LFHFFWDKSKTYPGCEFCPQMYDQSDEWFEVYFLRFIYETMCLLVCSQEPSLNILRSILWIQYSRNMTGNWLFESSSILAWRLSFPMKSIMNKCALCGFVERRFLYRMIYNNFQFDEALAKIWPTQKIGNKAKNSVFIASFHDFWHKNAIKLFFTVEIFCFRIFL